MSHILKLNEWQDECGYWHAVDTSDLPNGSAHWWLVPRMLNIDLVEYAKMLVEKYEVDKIYYSADKNVLGFSWKSQSKMRTYKNAINAAARKANFLI